MAKRQLLIQVPEEIQKAFKMACLIKEKSMTNVVVNFLENYSKGAGTLVIWSLMRKMVCLVHAGKCIP